MMRSIQQSLRTLMRRPVLTITGILTLGLGIGASTAIFSLLDTVALHPLAYRDAERLIGMGTVVPGVKALRGVSWPRFNALAADNHEMAEMAAYFTRPLGLTEGDRPEEVPGARVSSRFFDVFQVAPLLGRNFTAEEQGKGGGNVALLSAGFWRRRFGGDRSVLGKTLTIDGLPTVVVGVLPDVLRFPFEDINVWLPRPDEAGFISRKAVDSGAGYLSIVGRLKPGVPLSVAKQDVERIAAAYAANLPGQVDAKVPLAIQSFQEMLVGTTRTTLLVLLAAVGLVLLIACADVANILLVDGLSRRREIAARVALGAGRRQIFGQALRESVLLSVLGGLLGMLLAYVGLRLLVASHPANLPRIADVALSGRALGFAFFATTVAGVLAGLAPAWQTLRTDPKSFLVYGDRGAVGGKRGGWGQGLLVTAQITLALVLFSAAGLLLRSLEHVNGLKLGFAPDNLVFVQVTLPNAKYPGVVERRVFFEGLVERFRGVPGVQSAALIDYPPVVGTPQMKMTIEGQAPLSADQQQLAGRLFAGPGYFQTLRTPFLAGHDFDPRASSEATETVIVSRSFRDLYFAHENPLGKHLRIKNGTLAEIVGVVEDIQQNALEEGLGPIIFVNHHQAGSELSPPSFMNLAIRTRLPISSVTESLKREIRALDPSQSLPELTTMESMLRTSTARRRLTTGLFAAFSALALILSVLGIYGVVAHSVSLRSREIGVRMALGASPGRVLEGVLGLGGRWIIPGLLLGMVGSYLAGRALASQLFEVQGNDPLHFATTAVILGVVAFLACLVPAQRAMRIDPATTLRTP